MFLLAFLISAASTALNAGLYVATGSAWSLGGAIFCGALAAFNLAQAARS